MNVYRLPDGTVVTATEAFQIVDQSFPAGWLSTASDAEIAAAGIKVYPAVQVNSTATPALSGAYALDDQTRAKMLAVTLYIDQNLKFPDGLSPFPWPDASGTMHDFSTTAQFVSLASALADYVTALDLGQTPTSPITIP